MARALLLALGLAALPAFADRGDDIARLREEAAGLRQRLEELEAKIRALDGGSPEKRPEATPASLRQSWSEVQPGVSKERVNALLGEPARVMRINGDLVWYYVYPGLGPGSVFFSEKDKVTAVQAPRTGLW
jgi:hypothetical protein